MKKVHVKKTAVAVLISIMLFSSLGTNLQAVNAAQGKMTRISGNDRFNTSFEIGEQVKTTNVDCIVLTTGLNYADALSASVLAKKMDAPILLVNKSAKQSQDALTYISTYLDPSGKIYIIGGTGVIGSDFENTLKGLGITNIERIAGSNRYGTSSSIADEVRAPVGTPVVIASGNNFPDALSFSSFAAYNGWPILLVPGEELPESIADFLATNQPSTVYVAGGRGAISYNIEREIKKQVPKAKITRFSGKDRYETASKIVAEFAPSADKIYVATGNDFADALAGSVLAAQTCSPIVLVDSYSSDLPRSIQKYIAKLDNPDTYIFGGAGAVSSSIVNEIENIIEENASSTEEEKDSDKTENEEESNEDKDDKDDSNASDKDSDVFEVLSID